LVLLAGTTPNSIWTNTASPIYPFFLGLPKTYPAYVNTNNLGAFSYSYDFTGSQLGNMNDQCTSFKPTFLTLLKDEEDAANGGPTSDAACVNKETSWLVEATALASKFYNKPSDINNQVEMMLCVYYNECKGGVFDYTDEFKESMRVSVQPPCKKIIDDLARKDCVIGVTGWEDVLLKHFECNSPSAAF